MSSITKIDEIQGKLSEVNALIEPYKLAYVNPVEDCISLDKNAHYMDKAVLDKLTSNVAEDGFLSQLPFALKQEDGKYLILSGNHRLKAAIRANLQNILILYVEGIDKDKQIAYQLSHNALVGKDDLKMLKDIYMEMKSIEAKEFSGVSDMQFIDIEKINLPSIGDADIELTEIKFLFIESKSNEVNEILKCLEDGKIDKKSNLVVGDFEQFIKLATAVKKKFGIRSNTVAFSRMIDICNDYLESNGNN